MGSNSSVSPIHTMFQPYPDVSMNDIYDGSPEIIYVHLVRSVDASCSSRRILSTDYLTDVYFSRLTHDGSLPSTALTNVNSPFVAGIPIVAWRHFPMTKWNVLKFTHPLLLISFRNCNIFHVYPVIVICIFLIHQNSTLALHFLFPIGPRPFPIFFLY